ncbi:MAG: LapA family protein [Pseudomonadota bacterium]
MKKLIFACVMAFLFFVLLNFIYCNLDSTVFGYRIVFKFNIPYMMALKSVPLPMGFVLLMAFSAGMVAIALLEALPSFFKTLEIRSKNKKIRQLERELMVVRQLSDRSDLPKEEKKED